MCWFPHRRRHGQATRSAGRLLLRGLPGRRTVKAAGHQHRVEVAGHDGADGGHAGRAHAGELEWLGQLQHGDERGWEGRPVGCAKDTDRIVIGMMIGAEVTHRHITVRGRFDRARTEPAGGLTIDEQRQQHRGRIRFPARAALVDVTVAGGNRLHGIEEEVDAVIGGQPRAQIAGQEQRRLAVKINEAGGPEDQSRPAACWSNHFHCSCSG
jgi:hypothetical protein